MRNIKIIIQLKFESFCYVYLVIFVDPAPAKVPIFGSRFLSQSYERYEPSTARPHLAQTQGPGV